METNIGGTPVVIVYGRNYDGILLSSNLRLLLLIEENLFATVEFHLSLRALSRRRWRPTGVEEALFHDSMLIVRKLEQPALRIIFSK